MQHTVSTVLTIMVNINVTRQQTMSGSGSLWTPLSSSSLQLSQRPLSAGQHRLVPGTRTQNTRRVLSVENGNHSSEKVQQQKLRRDTLANDHAEYVAYREQVCLLPEYHHGNNGADQRTATLGSMANSMAFLSSETR